MKKKFTALALVALVLASHSILFAHEFWIMPSIFKLKLGQSTPLNFYAGEDYLGEVWAKRKERTLSLTHYTRKKKKDLTALAVQNDSIDFSVKFDNEGTHLLTMQSKNSFIGLEAAKFNEYLKDDGIDNIYALRQKNGEMNNPSRELYRRCAKTLIQVGDKMDKTFHENTGMPLEIIPFQNPYALKAGEMLTVQILFEGKPLINKEISTWQKTIKDKTIHQKLRTDKDGKAVITLDKNGQWMVSLVHMIPVINNPEGNYQSYWGSLTFEL